MKILIVESPKKCQTIKDFLSNDYKVIATKGHVRKLSSKGEENLGIDCENNFTPTYSIIKDKVKIINLIKKEALKAKEIILATDPDREGEAISWHLSEILKLKPDNKRIEFHEITHDSIINALKNPRTLNLNLVASQEARCIIDKIIGYRLSNVLMKQDNNLRSAGRVQSAVLKIIVDREKEILKFKPEKYWEISIILKKENIKLEAFFSKYKNKNIKLNDKNIVNEIVSLTGNKLSVLEINETIKTINPKLPFTTATMQQEAITKLGFSAIKVNFLAQQLYEGIKIDKNNVGLITYIRTDSTYLNNTYIENTKKYLKDKFGEKYVNKTLLKQQNKKFAQNAHEAIRPTDNFKTPEDIKKYLTNDQYQLYKLIYNRTLESLMTGKKEKIKTYFFGNESICYKTIDSEIIFPGYELLENKKENIKKINIKINKNDILDVIKIKKKQKLTTPPNHYSEASIIKIMEDKGIGRPSTYSTTISTLKKRFYIIKKKGAIIPTENGIKTVKFLELKFPDIVDVTFTANLEKNLDEIECGETNKVNIINKIYIPFMKSFNKIINEKIELGNCPKCGLPLVRVKGKKSFFTGCSGYPKCNYIDSSENKTKKLKLLDRKCPKCQSFLVRRTNKYGKEFIGCSGYPKCNYIEKITETK